MDQAELHRHYRPGPLPADPPKVPKRCGAKCRDGHACRTWAIWPSGRCRMHRGKAARGVGHYNYRHGGRSKDLVARMVSDYERALAEHRAETQHLLPIMERCLDNMAGGTGTPTTRGKASGSPAREQGPDYRAPAENPEPAAVETG
jgi:hypothetical protein